MTSEKRFGFEWNKYSDILPEYEKQFNRWTSLIKDWKNKLVLDAGCGNGRNSYWILKNDGKIIAFDNDNRSVSSALKNLKQFGERALVFPASIYNIDYQNKFDIAICIGVVHHLEKPKEAIDRLVQAIKPGGRILIWVYGFENNEWIVKYINPIRKLTSRLPVWLTHLIAYKFSIPLWAYIKLFHPISPYMLQLRRFTFQHIHSITFDQLLPKIARYYKREEAVDLLMEHPSLNNITIEHTNNNSWQVVGVKR